MVLSLPEGHAALLSTGQRFIAFDGAGLILLALAYLAVWLSSDRRAGSQSDFAHKEDMSQPVD